MKHIAPAAQDRQPVHTHRNSPAPLIVDRRGRQLREHLNNVTADKRADIGGRRLHIFLAPAKEQALVGRQAEIVEDEATVRDGSVRGQERVCVRDRCRRDIIVHDGDSEAAERAVNVVHPGVGGEDGMGCPDAALRRSDCHRALINDLCDAAVFKDTDARVLGCGGQPEHIVERMEMSALRVIQPAMIAIGADMLCQACAVQDRRFVSEGFEQFGFRRHIVQMCWLIGGLQMPRRQITVDFVAGDPTPHKVTCAPSNVEDRLGTRRTKFCLHLTHRPAQAGDQLPAITPRCAKADGFGFQQDDGKALLGTGKGGGDAGEAAADDDDITPSISLQPSRRALPVRGGRVVTVCQGVAHVRRGATNAHAPKS